MTTYPDIELYIDGRWKRADGHPIINPDDESVIGTVPHAAMADLDDALAAAERGYRIWKNTAPARRAQIVLKAASLIRERVDEMAVAMTLEQGKPIDQARLEILRGWMRPRACGSTDASSPVNRACGIPCCGSRSVWSRRSRRGISR